MTRLALARLAFAAFASPLLLAGTGGVHLDAPAVVEWRFDPFSAVAAAEPLQVDVETNGRTDLVLVAEPETAGPWRARGVGGAELPIRLDARGRPGPRFPLQGGAPELRLQVEPGSFAAPGDYRLEARLWVEAADSPGEALAERPLDIVVRVPASARAGFRGTRSGGRLGSVPTVDFGTLTGGDSRRIFVSLQANSDLHLTLRSEHGGHLAHIDGVDSIAYTLSLDGRPYDLAAPAPLALPAPATPAGDLLPVLITLPPDAHAHTAGRYRDILSVDVEAH